MQDLFAEFSVVVTPLLDVVAEAAPQLVDEGLEALLVRFHSLLTASELVSEVVG